MQILKNSKKTLVIFIAIFTCLTSSCKPTPDENIVISHNQKEFEKAILIRESDNDTIEYPVYYEGKYISKDKKVTITIDATVETPETTKYPVILINPSPISKEMTQWAIDEFMEGNSGYYASMSLNKEEIEDWILQLQADLADEERLNQIYNSDKDVEAAKEILCDKITQYTQMLIEAPTEVPKIPTDSVFRPFNFYVNYDHHSKNIELNMTKDELIEREYDEDVNLYLQSDVVLSNNLFARLTIYNEFPFSFNNRSVESVYGMEMYQIHVVYSYVPLSGEINYILDSDPFGYLSESGSLDSFYPDITIGEQDAIGIAKNIVNNIWTDGFYVKYCKNLIGVEDIRGFRNFIKDVDGEEISFENYLNLNDIKSKFYLVIMRPNYYGIPLLNANQEFYHEDEYNSAIAYEEIRIRVTNDSIAEFKWTNPTDISNVINDNVKIIPFEQAMKNANNFMQLNYNLPALMPIYPNIEGYEDFLKMYSDAEITITNIKLGLAGIPAYNSADEYLLIPVWNFYGSYKINAIEDKYDINAYNLFFPILSINAIDGSIIMQKAAIT
ncbi:MAG: DUF6034 family protein [Eubacteriales bacterium]